MCRQAPITDAEIKALCTSIISSQQSEIDQMKRILERLDGRPRLFGGETFAPERERTRFAGLFLLFAGHGAVLLFVSSHTAASATLASAVIVLVVIKHIGLLGPLYALVRRRFGRERKTR